MPPPNPIVPDFSHGEYRQRIRRIQEILKQRNLDGLFLTQAEHVYYTTGFLGIMPWLAKHFPYVVLIGRDRDPLMVVPEHNVQTARDTCWVEEIKSYSMGMEDAPGTITAAIKDSGLEGAKIGAELGNLLRVALPTQSIISMFGSNGGTFVDGSEAIWQMRMVKTKIEIDRMRVAVRAASRGADRAFDEFKEGMTEREFSRLTVKHMIEEGADRPSFVIISSGRQARPVTLPTDRKIRKGDYVSFDWGANFRFYMSDLHRIAHVGGAVPEKQRDQHALVVEANKAGIRSVKPGRKVSDVHAAMARVYAEAGMSVPLSLMGHGLGLDGHERPLIDGVDNTLIEPGMLLSIEPVLTTGKAIGFNVEDNLVVTRSGSEVLSTISRELRII